MEVQYERVSEICSQGFSSPSWNLPISRVGVKYLRVQDKGNNIWDSARRYSFAIWVVDSSG